MSLPRSIARVVTPPLIAGILAIHLDGCAGSVPEPRGIGDPRASGQPTIQRVGIGTEIEIARRDGVVVRGRFLGTSGMTAEAYARHRVDFLAYAQEAADAEIPAPGEILEIRPRSGSTYAPTFASFTLEGMEVRWADDSCTIVPYRQIREVHTANWKRSGAQLAVDAVTGRLPISTVVRLGVAENEVEVFVDQIARVTPPGTHGDLGLGILIGVTAGVVLVIVIAAATWKPSCGSIDVPPGLLGGFTWAAPDSSGSDSPHFPPRTAMTS